MKMVIFGNMKKLEWNNKKEFYGIEGSDDIFYVDGRWNRENVLHAIYERREHLKKYCNHEEITCCKIAHNNNWGYCDTLDYGELYYF